MDYESLTQKQEILAGFRPLPKELVQNLEEWFKVELTYTSNAIEGNTLTRRETALVVEKGLTVGGKSLIEHLEATNHALALDFVKQQVERDSSDLRESDILTIHSTILRGIDDTNAGTYRTVPVRISGSEVRLPPPLKIPDLMTAFCDWLKSVPDLHPVELAAEAHYRLVTIHPFVDGNGRTARLLMNLILMMHGYPPAIIRKRDRLAYISALEQAQVGGSKADYHSLIHKAVDRSLEIYLKAFRGEEESQPVAASQLLKIGQLAKLVGKNNSTIRHWTKLELLEVAQTTESGYQLYPPEAVDLAKRILELQKQRFTLEEIKAKL